MGMAIGVTSRGLNLVQADAIIPRGPESQFVARLAVPLDASFRRYTALRMPRQDSSWPAEIPGLACGLGKYRRPLPAAGSKCDHRGMTEREEFVTWVQSVLCAVEIAIHNRDAGPRRAIWSQNDPVTVLGAWKNASGQQELDELFAHLAESFSDCTSLRVRAV